MFLPLMLVICIPLIVWYLWFITTRPDDFLRLAKAEEERREARHKRNKSRIEGAFNVAAKLLKK